jgi:hypothetical protein
MADAVDCGLRLKVFDVIPFFFLDVRYKRFVLFFVVS